ncbi:DUF6308 family protein [Catellatospora sp. NPDC049111]|uniref:DUF6308 family protein n=1 Tax=Catellatospora sp. NPDC049111 TaxID=3155271 RepID=UPI0033FB4BBE
MDHQDLLAIVDHPSAENALRCYYTGWSGRRFESLGRLEGADPDPHEFTPVDIVAVSLLSVNVPAEAAIGLLEGDPGRRLSALLRDIPADVDLGTNGAGRLIDDKSPARTAWNELTDQRGIGSVIAGKLLARKRPRLIPVYDAVVGCVLNPPQHEFWTWLHHQLRTDGGALLGRLAKLRTDADLPEPASAIRVLDVVLWMFHRRVHTNAGCSGFNLAEVPSRPNCTAWRA